MGRKESVESCMLCDPEPCACRAKPKKQAQKPESKPAITHKSIGNTSKSPRGELRDKIRQSAAAAPVYAPPPAFVARTKAHVPEKSEEELLLCSTIQTLAILGILHEEEQGKWGLLIRSPLTAMEKSTIWRARRKWSHQ